MNRKLAKSLAKGDLDAFWKAFENLAYKVITKKKSPRITKEQFQKILEEFFYLTFDAYISGAGDRMQAMGHFEDWLSGEYAGIPANFVFISVDQVHSYT